ncbi:MAG: glycosyltransferase family 2 protein [Ignavibacteria bacterium]|nr:glycosyltransferase family 2 protein [Ignavibacteria bacterium]
MYNAKRAVNLSRPGPIDPTTDLLSDRASRDGALDVSLVIPLYNECESLPELAARITDVLAGVTEHWEAWFIDDGSDDGSAEAIETLHRADARVKLIRFRRNYGKSAALAVGFEHAQGAYVITMDADLQDAPEEIPHLIAKIDEGYDMVSGWKKKRYDPISKTIPSKFFNFVTGKMSGIDLHDFNCGLKAYRRVVIKSVHVYGEMHRYIPVLAKQSGFTVAELAVEHHPRKYGTTKFGLSRFFKGFLDLLTVMFTSRYTQRPLHVFGTIGTVMLLLGMGINVALTVEWIMGRPVSNRPLLFLGILLMLVGIQLISTGLLAEMITKREHTTTDYLIRDTLS